MLTVDLMSFYKMITRTVYITRVIVFYARKNPDCTVGGGWEGVNTNINEMFINDV